MPRISPKTWDRFKRYGVALISLAVMTAGRALIAPLLAMRAADPRGGRQPPGFVVYYVAVAFSAWYGGFGPAVLALVLGALIGLFVFIEHPGDMFADPSRTTSFVIFCITGLLVAALGAARRRAVFRASEQREILDHTLSQMSDGLIVIDGDLNCIYVNDRAVELSGQPRAALTGGHCLNLVPPERRAAFEMALRQVSQRRTPGHWELLLPQRRIWIEVHASPSPQGVTIVASDITQRKQAVEQIERALQGERAARTEAERVNRVKDEFLATLSHELRTPLNSMLGWSQLLRDRHAPPEELQQGLAAIERNARAQAQLIEDLLDLSRITAGRMKLDVKNLDFAAIVSAALESAAPAAAAKRIRIVRDIDPSTPNLHADPVRLQQIIWNLLSNAIKFTPPEGQVTLKTAQAGDQLELSVSDTGIGIAADFLPLVFGRFQQADSSTTRRHGGLGLGLAIVRHLVELHGGTIEARSAGPNHGATFVVRLPLTQLPAGAPATVPDESIHDRRLSLQGVRVLVIDDEADTLDVVRRVLSGSAAEVTTVTCAADGLQAISRLMPDVLISDIGMPDQDGYSLIGQVRQLPPERGGAVPALALTAFASPNDRKNALAAGFQAYLAKPIEASELIRAVQSLRR